MNSVNVNVGELVEYSSNKLLRAIGKDSFTVGLKNKLKERIKIELFNASYIKSIGMVKPIKINDIYQPTVIKTNSYEKIDHQSLIEKNDSYIIKGHPGSGKSIFLNWILCNDLSKNDPIKLMYRLRAPGEIEELSHFVEEIIETKAIKKKEKFLILVDGYDEVNELQRKIISQILGKILITDKIQFILTCRYYYHIYDLKVKEYYVSPFSIFDAENFLKIYLKLYNVKDTPDKVINELVANGFSDYLENPLMLTLICVLKTSSLKNLPKQTVSLVQRAVDTLGWRWDESKGVSRESKYPLDARNRIDLLEQIAYNFELPEGDEIIALNSAENYLNKSQYLDIIPKRLLEEIAQWFGIFVPTSNGKWLFTHRTMHDYLAAAYWVKSGLFASKVNSIKNWNTRTAYAASISTDATKCIVNSLKKTKDEFVLMQCLKNNASFDSSLVAKAVVKHIKNNQKYSLQFDFKEKCNRINLKMDLAVYASIKFLISLISESAKIQGQASLTMYLEGIFQLIHRFKDVDYFIPKKQNLEEVYIIRKFVFRVNKEIDQWNISKTAPNT